MNLQKFARALRVRWLWHEWTSPEKAWVGTGTPCDDDDRLLFAACTTISVGNGQRTRFWSDAWVQGRRPKDIAPRLFARTTNKNKSVAEALNNNRWISDLNYRFGFSIPLLQELILLWNLIRNYELHPERDDTITWRLTNDGNYTAASAYKAQFIGSVKNPRLATVWQTCPPPLPPKMQVLCVADSTK